MRKIITTTLCVELTQLCNLDCKHCLKGESRNVHITREILERAFSEIKYIERLFLTGGEVFLAYEQLKMLLEIAKEKKVYIEKCAMLINGTVYDERVYALLDEYFKDKYTVSISSDVYHDESIARKFQDNIDTAIENIIKHYDNKHFANFVELGNLLINTGNAKSLDVFKNEPEAIGYYYDYWKDVGLLVGPIIFLGSDGYISEGNLETDRRSAECLGNILEESIGEMVERGGIHGNYGTLEAFYKAMYRREWEYQHHKGDHWRFENHKLVPYHYVENTAYKEALDDAIKLMQLFQKKGWHDPEFQACLTQSIEKFPHDISQIVHRVS